MENENENKQGQQEQQGQQGGNPDVEAIKKMQRRFDADIQKEKEKYTALLKYVAEGGKASPEEPPEPSPAEKEKHVQDIVKEIAGNKLNGVEQAKRILEYDEYVRANGGRTIFAASYGTPDVKDIESADRVRDLLKYAVDTCEGNEELFQAAITSKLKDIN